MKIYRVKERATGRFYGDAFFEWKDLLALYEKEDFDSIQGSSFENVSDLDGLNQYIKEFYPKNFEDFEIIEMEGSELKYYKEFDKDMVPIGYSDIASLVMVGCRDDQGAVTELLHFGEDGFYWAYVVEGAKVIIGNHYEKRASFNNWLKIYDDSKLMFKTDGRNIDVYRAGDFGCIIHIY